MVYKTVGSLRSVNSLPLVPNLTSYGNVALCCTLYPKLFSTASCARFSDGFLTRHVNKYSNKYPDGIANGRTQPVDKFCRPGKTLLMGRYLDGAESHYLGIRLFSSSSSMSRFNSRRKSPQSTSPLKFIFNTLPTPVKSFLPIAGAAGILFFVAAPLLILVLPPLVLVGILYFRRLRAIRKSLFEKRWNEMASYHMKYQSDKVAFDEQEALKKLVMRRIAEAIQDNEHDMAKNLGFKLNSGATDGGEDVYNRSHLGLTDIHSIEEDWRVSPQGMTQFMTVYSLGLVDKNRSEKKIADVNIVVRTQNSEAGNKTGMPFGNKTRDVRIEIVSHNGFKKNLYVLEGSDKENVDWEDGPVIDVQARKP